MGSIKLIQQRQFRLLSLGRDTGRKIQIRDRFLAHAVDPDSLVGRRHKTAAPVARPVDRPARTITHHDERREIFIVRSQSIGRPRTKRRPTGDINTGVHLTDTTGVVDPVGPTGSNHGDVIQATSNIRNPFGRPHSALPVLFPAPRRGQQGSPPFAHRGQRLLE